MDQPIRIPRHVAIIMDGNGRWAQRRRHPRVFGHVRGTSRVKPVVREADRLGIRALTLYAFSTENWSRPEGELSTLWKLMRKFIQREADELDRENVRLEVIGETDRLGSEIRSVLDPVIERMSKNTGLRLTIALSYGSRRELARAARLFAEDCATGRAKPEDMNEAALASYLWTSRLGELADVDLVIRTSGEVRVSNFLLWQAAYAEYIFEQACWPDFTPAHLRAALEEYSRRERRFGGLAAPTGASSPVSGGVFA
jgi:undecaprenyl diphosphate synthase